MDPVVPQPSADIVEFGQRISEGRQKVKAGDLSGAIADLTRAAELVPRSTQAWGRLADAYYRAQDYVAAEAAARRWLEIAPDDPVALLHLGASLCRLGLAAAAIPFFEASLARRPGHRETTERLARAHLLAAQDLAPDLSGLGPTGCAAAGPSLPAGEWLAQGAQRLGAGDLDGATAAFGQAARTDPRSIEAWARLADGHYRAARYAEAEAAARQWLALTPDEAAAWFNLGKILSRREQWSGSAACFEEALRRRPERGETVQRLSRARSMAARLSGPPPDLDLPRPEQTDELVFYPADLRCPACGAPGVEGVCTACGGLAVGQWGDGGATVSPGNASPPGLTTVPRPPELRPVVSSLAAEVSASPFRPALGVVWGPLGFGSATVLLLTHPQWVLRSPALVGHPPACPLDVQVAGLGVTALVGFMAGRSRHTWAGVLQGLIAGGRDSGAGARGGPGGGLEVVRRHAADRAGLEWLGGLCDDRPLRPAATDAEAGGGARGRGGGAAPGLPAADDQRDHWASDRGRRRGS